MRRISKLLFLISIFTLFTTSIFAAKDFSFTAKSLVNKFSSNASKLNFDGKLYLKDYQSGSQQNIQNFSTKVKSIDGYFAIDKGTNKVENITMIAKPTNAQESQKMTMYMVGLILSSNSNLTPPMVNEILQKLFDGANNRSFENTYTKSGIKYFLSSSEISGLMFGIYK